MSESPNDAPDFTPHMTPPLAEGELAPVPGDPAFIGPLTVEDTQKLEMSYLLTSLPDHAREVLHKGVMNSLGKMAMNDNKYDLSTLNNQEQHDLRKRVFAARINKRRR